MGTLSIPRKTSSGQQAVAVVVVVAAVVVVVVVPRSVAARTRAVINRVWVRNQARTARIREYKAALDWAHGPE